MTNDSTRKRIHGRTAAIALVVIALIGAGCAVYLWRQSQYISRRAAAQSVAAALARTESLRGPLEVQCDGVSGGRFLRNVRYASKGGQSWIEVSYGDSTQTWWYDARTHEGRDMLVTPYGISGTSAIITGQPGPGSIMTKMPDPIKRSLDSQALVEALKRGEVADSQETVDGHACWRVVIPSREVKYERFVVWVDPSIGFLPRRIAFVGDRGRSSFQSFTNYKQLRPGVWFPMRMSCWNAGGPEWYVSTVRQVHTGGALPKDSLKIVFPSGTRVEDQIAHRTYVAP